MAVALTTQALRAGVDKIFKEIWKDTYETINLTFEPYISMPRRGRYQIWKGGEILADHIKHRREALAVMKLLKENKDGTS